MKLNTGKKDKSGVEICDGSVVTQGDNRNFEISFSEKDGEWCVGAHLFSGLAKSYWTNEIEVIGSIDENPKLLEKAGVE